MNPISAAQSEANDDTGQTYLTQYFERQRFEYHPESARPYDVQLGRLGDDYLRHLNRDWHSLPKADPHRQHYRPETGHAIAPNFIRTIVVTGWIQVSRERLSQLSGTHDDD